VLFLETRNRFRAAALDQAAENAPGGGFTGQVTCRDKPAVTTMNYLL
jgi:hypothetical protein